MKKNKKKVYVGLAADIMHEGHINILKVAKECVITLPNFGNWELRSGLFAGKMPSSDRLPAKWYETKNIHLCTIAEFEELCDSNGYNIKHF